MEEARDFDALSCREAMDAAPAIIWRADAESFRFTFISHYAEVLLGYPLRNWSVPGFWGDHMYPEDRDFIATSRQAAIRKERSYDLEYRMMAADGRILWVREIGLLTPDGDLAGVIVDLSRKRSVQAALSKSKLWLRQVIDSIPQQIWSGPSDGSVDFVNERWSSELGITVEEVQKTPDTMWQKILHPEDRDRVLKAWRESVTSGAPYEQEERHKMADGQYRWYLCRGVPLRDERGGITRWFGTNTDIELQKRAEEDLRRSEERWRAVFDNAYVGVAVLDSDLRYVAANAAYMNMVGYTAEELRSVSCLDVTDQEDRSAYQLLGEELLAGKRDHFRIEKRYRRKDGTVLWARVNGSILPVRPGEPRLWVVIAEDINERKRLHDELERERDWLRLLLDLTHQFVAKLEVPSVIDAVLAGLERRDDWRWAAVLLPERGGSQLKVYLNRGGEEGPREGLTTSIEGTIAGAAYRSGQPMVFRAEDLPGLSAEYPNISPWLLNQVSAGRFTRGCILPLIHGGQVLGILFLGTGATRELAEIDLDRWQELAQFVAAALWNALRYDELTSSRERLAHERDIIQEQVRTTYEFENIIGRSKGFEEVLRQVQTVAPTDSTVLILGETGTGKELIARTVHDRSLRRKQAFVKIDCAAIPAALLESELFGHERGAFTGAVAQKPGRFEIADKGTLFLDEVGDIPLELQTKLLRVLQDQAFERLGSNHTIHLDVRVIAATNRDLEQMIAQGQFRADLYYRLKVFPILIPPLRERPDDIPPLVWHYVRKYAHRLRKNIETIPPATMEVFSRYPWPGNVRELQHFMERSVVLTSGTVLQAPRKELEEYIRKRRGTEIAATAGRTLEEIERESILRALQESNWIVGGPTGAAARLGLKRTTLASRMERLGISRKQQRARS